MGRTIRQASLLVLLLFSLPSNAGKHRAELEWINNIDGTPNSIPTSYRAELEWLKKASLQIELDLPESVLEEDSVSMSAAAPVRDQSTVETVQAWAAEELLKDIEIDSLKEHLPKLRRRSR